MHIVILKCKEIAEQIYFHLLPHRKLKRIKQRKTFYLFHDTERFNEILFYKMYPSNSYFKKSGEFRFQIYGNRDLQNLYGPS